MTTQHTHPEHGDVDAQAVADQHVPEMQETLDESTLSTFSTPSTSSVQVEQSSQSNQQEDTDNTVNTTDVSSTTIPSLLSFTIPIAAATFSTSVEGETEQSSQVSQVHNESSEMLAQAAGDVSVASDTPESVEPIATSEETSSDIQGDEVSATDIYPLSVDEQLPLEPASFSLTHDATQEEQATSEGQDVQNVQNVQNVQEQPEASTEQDDAMVRPFMEYFEEFRQSEARSQSDASGAFTEFALSNAAETPSSDDVSESSSVSGMPNEEVLPPFDFGEGSSFIPTGDESTGSVTVNENDASAQSPMEAAVSEENQRVAAVEQEHAENTRPERPVSPLLRRDNRHRLRHGGPSHREEFVRSQGNEAPSMESVPVQAVHETQAQPMQETPEDKNVVEASVETPKPTRRYRFDRPAPAVQQGTPRTYGGHSARTAATNGGSSTPEASATPESTASTITLAAQETQPAPVSSPVAQEGSSVTTPTDRTNTASTTTGVSATPQEEQSLKREAATIEQNATTNATSTTSTPVEHGRRKHGQERHREKEPQVASTAQAAPVTPIAETVPTSVADIAALVAETHDALQGDVAPEDMPPLEYADLQKGTARRRRRHRPGQPVTTGTESTRKVQEPQPQIQTQAQAQGTPVVQETQMTPSSQQPSAMPVASQNTQSMPPQSTQPAAPPVASAQGNPSYSLTSGFTLGQMNQGNEVAGPFMGPEPSPARGSVFTRDGRTTRAENIRPSSYQPRDNGASGGGPSSASMNHFANVVAQAIQVQSDRMVAEMRRVNQAPTNVSVSLPPFPSTERVGVFVDVANLLYSARTMRIAIDFGKLLDFLRGNRRLVRAHAYCPTSPQPGDEQMFLQAVKGLGYRITTKNYKTFASGAKKADLDLDLCMDVVRLVDGHAIDDIVLVSGDSDFMPMLDYCSDHGVRVEVAAFDEAMSATLRQSCDMFVNLSMLEEIRA